MFPPARCIRTGNYLTAKAAEHVRTKLTFERLAKQPQNNQCARFASILCEAGFFMNWAQTDLRNYCSVKSLLRIL